MGELVECIRKYLTVSVAVAVFMGFPSSQILMAAIICIMYNSLFLYYAPYIVPQDDALAYFNNTTLLFIFLLAGYTRLTSRLADSLRLAEQKLNEVFAMNALVDIASLLTFTVLVSGLSSTAWELYILFAEGPENVHTLIPGERVRMTGCSVVGSSSGSIPEGCIRKVEGVKIVTKHMFIRYTVDMKDGSVRTFEDHGDDKIPLLSMNGFAGDSDDSDCNESSE